MGYVRRASIRPQGERRIGIRTKNPEGDLTPAERLQVQAAVTKARRILPGVHAELIKAPNRQAHGFTMLMLQYIFLHPNGGQILFIAANLVKIINGINLSQRLKIHTIPDAGADDDGNRATNAYGYVRRTKSGNHYGRINISRDLFVGNQAELALVTYIHEASHKYADTKDYYGGQWQNEEEAAGYRSDARGELETEGAIDNADSYGWFCYMVAEGLRL